MRQDASRSWTVVPRTTVRRQRGAVSASSSAGSPVPGRARRSPRPRRSPAPRRPPRRRRRGAAARQPPSVWAANAADRRPALPGVRCRTAARTVPHGSSGVTGESEPRASATPAAAIAANGLRSAPGRRRAARRTCRSRRPRAGRTPAARDATTPRSASVGDRSRRRPSRRARCGAAPPRSRSAPTCSAASPKPGHDRVERAVADRVEAGLHARPRCRRRRGRGPARRVR